MVETINGHECYSAWEKAAARGALADAVVEYVRQYDWVTFVELQRRFSAFMPTEGHMSYEFEGVPNVVLWAGMSEEFSELIEEVRLSKRIFPHGASVLCYLIDGGALQLPIAKRIPKNGYRKPHWAPVAFRLTPIK